MAIDQSGWLLGAMFGLAHGMFAGTAHNYGLATPIVSMAAHVAYGALVGGFTSLAG